MFTTHTEKTNRAIFFAQYHAQRMCSPCVEPHHLILGFVREDKALVDSLLSSGMKHGSLLTALMGRISYCEGQITRGSYPTPLSPTSQIILKAAEKVAETFNEKKVHTHALLVALLEAPDEINFGEFRDSVKILEKYGISAEKVRKIHPTLHTSLPSESIMHVRYQGDGLPRPDVETNATFLVGANCGIVLKDACHDSAFHTLAASELRVLLSRYFGRKVSITVTSTPTDPDDGMFE